MFLFIANCVISFCRYLLYLFNNSHLIYPLHLFMTFLVQILYISVVLKLAETKITTMKILSIQNGMSIIVRSFVKRNERQ